MKDFFEAVAPRSMAVGTITAPNGAATKIDTSKSVGDSFRATRQSCGTLGQSARTRQRPSFRAAANDSNSNVRTLKIQRSGGEQQYVLERGQGGLYVVCEGTSAQGAQTRGLMQFEDAGSFERWWDDDQLRFEQPLAHLAVKRFASELWGSDAGGNHS